MTLQSLVLAYMRQHPDEELPVGTIAEAIGMTGEQAGSALRGLLRKCHPRLKNPRPGWWAYGSRPVTEQTQVPRQALPIPVPDDIYEPIGTDREGRVLLRSTAGVVGRFEPI